MSRDQRTSNSLALADTIVEGMLEKKGFDVVVMDLSNIPSAICDYFVISHGGSTTQVEALADSVEEIVASGQVPADELLAKYKKSWSGDINRIYSEYAF